MSAAAAPSDSLSQFTMTRQDILEGPARVQDRDAPVEQFHRQPTEKIVDNRYRVWERAQKTGPKSESGNGGSFRSLIDSGKIQTGDQRQPAKQKKQHLPGYTGFVVGQQHISGRRFGETTRRAYDTSYAQHVCTSPIPSAPHANRRIKQETLKDSFCYNMFGNKDYHLPGYTGHVQGARTEYGRTYGSTTRDHLDKFNTAHNRPNPQEREGYAYTMKARHQLHISNNPLAGAPYVTKAPLMLFPSKLGHLSYYAE